MNNSKEASFDVAIIGGGINGTSAARHLAAAGYSVILLEKGDFGCGATSRSTRVLHCGLRFLETGEPFWKTLARPGNLLRSLESARRYMRMRSELASSIPERVFPFTCFLPVYADDRFSAWQVGLALSVLKAIGPKNVPLAPGRLSLEQASQHALLRHLRDRTKLTSVHTFREYRHDWPERMAVDNALDARRMGAAVRNYAAVTGLRRLSNGAWSLTVTESGRETTLEAKLILNTAGPWIDRVNGLASSNARSRVIGTKGAHIVLKLPDACRGFGLVNIMSDGMPAYLVPWRHTHHFGPTDTKFDGDIDDIRVTAEEIEFLLDEINHLIPGAGITRRHIVGTWAGVRPWTNEVQPGRKRVMHSVLHDMSDGGMDGVFALTGASITSHRESGRMIVAKIRERLTPSGQPVPFDYAIPHPPRDSGAPLSNSDPEITVERLRHSARNEQVAHLADLLMRRLGADYAETKGVGIAENAARAVADILGWDETRIAEEVKTYTAAVEHLYGLPGKETVR